MLGESDRDRAERIIQLMGKDWMSLSDLAGAANVDNYQMARFLREHILHENCVVQEPVLERRLRQIRDIRRVQLSEYRRKVEVQVAESV